MTEGTVLNKIISWRQRNFENNPCIMLGDEIDVEGANDLRQRVALK